MPVKKPEPAAAETTDTVREYRIERFRDDLRFTQKEAETLADSHGANGFPVDWHFVQRALKNGLNHRKVVDLLADL